jgi:uncharacterized RDD family membrane protein YckC
MYTIIGGDGQEYGPVSPGQIRQWMAAGRVNAQTRAKAFGTEEWKPIGEFEDFAPAAASPPLLDDSAAGHAGFGSPLPLASRVRRLVAQIVDGVIGGICCIPLLVAVPFDTLMTAVENHDTSALTALPGIVSGGAFTMLGMLILFCVQIFLLATRGQTIGKLLLAVRIVQFPNGERVGLVKSFLLRACLMSLIEAVPYVGSLITLVDLCFIFRADRRCLHDHLAGTMVVNAS